MNAFRYFISKFFLMALLLIGVTSVGIGATRTTTGGQWTNASTWQGGNFPVANGLDDIYSNTNNMALYVNASGLIISGATFTKTASLTLWNNASLTINGNVAAASNLTITVQSGATLIVNGSITSTGGAVTITVDQGGTLLVDDYIQAKNQVSITAGGDVDILGDVTSANGNVSLVSYDNGGGLYIDGTVSANGDLDITSNDPIEITGGVNAGNNTSFTANDDLIIGGVVDVGNNATFTGNGSGATFELGGITAGQGTSLTFNGDATIKGSVNLGNNTNMTVNTGKLVVTDDFIAGGGSTNYTVHSEMVVGGILSLDNGNDGINGYGTVTTGGTCNYNTTSSSTITQNCEVTLPVSLLSFSAKVENSSVLLSWSTASEEDNDFFTISRSYNGLDFEELATVSGQGDSKSLVTYEWVDYGFDYQQAYYQLRQTDYDGTEELLGTVVVYPEEFGASPLTVAPNPASASSGLKLLNASLSGGTYTLLSLNGRIYMKGTVDSSNVIPLINMNAGMYMLKVEHYNALFEAKIIIR